MTKYAAPIAVVVGIAMLAFGGWAWTVISSMRFVESVTKFDIPFGTRVVGEHYASARLGAESLRITVYELDGNYADTIFEKCESLGYLRLTREQAGEQFPALEKYLLDDAPVCARKVRSEVLSVSILQEKRLIVFIMS